MSQNAEKVLDHFNLFREPEYQEMFKNKKAQFENPVPQDKLVQVREWTKTWDYREKNFAREALTVNPAFLQCRYHRPGFDAPRKEQHPFAAQAMGVFGDTLPGPCLFPGDQRFGAVVELCRSTLLDQQAGDLPERLRGIGDAIK